MVVAKHLSVFDPGSVLKDAHDEQGHALRMRDANSQVPSGYSRAVFTKLPSGSITKAIFYAGTTAEKTRIKFFGDVGGSLNSKYFLINTAEDQVQYYVWYNNGTGIDPAIVGRVGVEIPFVNNDPAALITKATNLYFFNSCEHFAVETNGDDVLLIENVDLGETTNSSDVSTGFGITTTNEGITRRICTLTLPADPKILYLFNEAERKFEIFPVATFAITDPVEVYGEVSVAGISITAGQTVNVPAPLANTEYSFTLAIGIRSFEISARGTAKVQWTYQAGQSGTIFKTLSPGATYERSGLVLTAPLTIYFQTTKASETLEVVTYS